MSATRADKTPDNAASTSTATHREPVLILNGQLDARPGELVDIRIDGISRTQGRDGVTADSRAFAAPARMRWQDGVYWTVATLAMSDKPGWYPLSVTVAGGARGPASGRGGVGARPPDEHGGGGWGGGAPRGGGGGGAGRGRPGRGRAEVGVASGRRGAGAV
ncbi:hypothetical protein ACWDBO_48975, partial [Streptomyces mirabilis]